MPREDDARRVAEMLRRIVRRDEESGAPRTLPQYQRLFPGFEQIVAAELDRISRDTAVGPASGGDVRASTPAPLPENGAERMGPYVLIRELGRGGMGVVHLA